MPTMVLVLYAINKLIPDLSFIAFCKFLLIVLGKIITVSSKLFGVSLRCLYPFLIIGIFLRGSTTAQYADRKEQ